MDVASVPEAKGFLVSISFIFNIVQRIAPECPCDRS